MPHTTRRPRRGSCILYSRFTILGGLFMIDMCFLLFSSLSHWTGKTLCKQRVPCLQGWSDPMIFLGSQRLPNVGSLQPNFVFCPRPKLNVAPCASSVLLNTSVHRRGERNARQKVICVFHATFTMPRSFSGRCERCWVTRCVSKNTVR
jgi:hypothetical protein